LDAQQAPAGGKADLPQRGQIGQPFPDPEIGGSTPIPLPTTRTTMIAIHSYSYSLF